MATQDNFTRLMGTTTAAGVQVGQDMVLTSPQVSDALMCGSSGADVDHGKTAWNHGFGAMGSKQPRLVVKVGTAMNPATSATFKLRQGSDSPVTADIVTLYEETILVAALTADTVIIDIPLPEITDQYVELQVTWPSTDPTTGTLFAWIQLSAARGHGL